MRDQHTRDSFQPVLRWKISGTLLKDKSGHERMRDLQADAIQFFFCSKGLIQTRIRELEQMGSRSCCFVGDSEFRSAVPHLKIKLKGVKMERYCTCVSHVNHDGVLCVA